MYQLMIIICPVAFSWVPLHKKRKWWRMNHVQGLLEEDVQGHEKECESGMRHRVEEIIHQGETILHDEAILHEEEIIHLDDETIPRDEGIIHHAEEIIHLVEGTEAVTILQDAVLRDQCTVELRRKECSQLLSMLEMSHTVILSQS